MAKRSQCRINLLLGIDKPSGMTSHDVVARVRRSLGERRVGHAGTLDPMATGVMVVGVGQATRLLGLITLDTKSYIAEITFGAETDTDDAEGRVVREASARPELFDSAFASKAVTDVIAARPELFDSAFASKAVTDVIGVQEQVPPAYSAISVNGVRSYKRARSGEDVELPARTIEVIDALLLGVEKRGGNPVWTVAFTVSKGTYIRALARDLGRTLDNAAHLSALRRTASGSIGISSCLALDEVNEASAQASALDPVAVLGALACSVGEDVLGDIANGRRLPAASVPTCGDTSSSRLLGLTHRDALVALARRSDDLVVPEMVFPQPIGGVHL